MLQSFLIIRDRPGPAMNKILEEEESDMAELSLFETPDTLLYAAGLRAQETVSAEPLSKIDVRNIDAVIFHVPYNILLQWMNRLEHQHSAATYLWWCDREPIVHNCVLSDAIDGILYPGMTTEELHWSLMLSAKHFLARTQWKQEREQLIAKLEDRKWIDRAKAILSEVKSITEAEAYEFLRKQAMNERRRMVDVAVSIVKVYSLLREQKPGGRTR